MPFRVTRSGTTNLTYRQTLDFDIPTRGVRTENANDWLERVRAFALVLPPDTAFSHTTAARLQDLPLPPGLHVPVHVTTDVGGRRGRRKGLVWHQRPLRNDRELWHGLAVTTPLRTWRDLADVLDDQELVVVADVLLRRRICSPRGAAGCHRSTSWSSTEFALPS